MTTDQIIKSVRIVDDVQRRTFLNSPAIQRVMKDARFAVLDEQLRDRVLQQIDFQQLIRPELLEQMRKQNEIFLESPGVKKLLASIDFKIPEGLADQLAAYADQVAVEVADPESGEERAYRLAQEREAIVYSFRMVAVAAQGFAHVPESPLSSRAAYLFVVLWALSEAANRILSEREDDQ